MQVNVRTGDNIVRRAGFIESVQAEVAAALDRFSDRTTRVDIHLRDANAAKAGGRDEECTIEARLPEHRRSPKFAHLWPPHIPPVS